MGGLRQEDPVHLLDDGDRHAGVDRRRHSALIGFAGFHSKDAIIEAAYAAHTPHNYVFWTLVAGRLHDLVLFLAPGVHDLPPVAALGWMHAPTPTPKTITAQRQITATATHEPHESPLVMLIPLGVLAFGAVFAGVVVPKILHRHHARRWR